MMSLYIFKSLLYSCVRNISLTRPVSLVEGVILTDNRVNRKGVTVVFLTTRKTNKRRGCKISEVQKWGEKSTNWKTRFYRVVKVRKNGEIQTIQRRSRRENSSIIIIMKG